MLFIRYLIFHDYNTLIFFIHEYIILSTRRTGLTFKLGALQMFVFHYYENNSKATCSPRH